MGRVRPHRCKCKKQKPEEKKEEVVIVKPALRRDGKSTDSADGSMKERVFEKANEMLHFLEHVEDQHGDFFRSPKFIGAAFTRFEFWFNLLNSQPNREIIYPPIDVAYIWHSYVIRTEFYFEDIEKIVPGSSKWIKKVTWKWSSSKETTSYSEKLWDSVASGKLDSSFDSFSLPTSLEDIPEQKSLTLPFQLKMESVLDDLNWLSDLRLGCPAFTSPATRSQFLCQSLDEYFKWLNEIYTKKEQQNEFEEGPAIDLDIFWHAHLLSPGLYENDVLQQFGKIIWHCPKVDLKEKGEKEEEVFPKELSTKKRKSGGVHFDKKSKRKKVCSEL